MIAYDVSTQFQFVGQLESLHTVDTIHISTYRYDLTSRRLQVLVMFFCNGDFRRITLTYDTKVANKVDHLTEIN